MPFKKGGTSPKKGKTYEEIYGRERAKEIGAKISLANKGKKFSKEHKRKISENNKGMSGRKHTKEAKRKMSKVASRTFEERYGEEKAKVLRKKISRRMTRKQTGRTWEQIFGIDVAKRMRKQKSELMKRQIPWNLGVPSPRKGQTNVAFFGEEKAEEMRLNLSISCKGNVSPFVGMTNEERYGVEQATEIREKNSRENHWNWQGGISNEPYPFGFDDSLKKIIKAVYNDECQLCGRLGMDVHHIDYNKMNCSFSNLILLCKVCHAKTGSNRKYWEVRLGKLVGCKL